jgi:hypothetical protein
MWAGFDPELQRTWQIVRGMAARQRQTPTREWPLVLDQESGLLLVVREWPDGSVTSYATSEFSGRVAGGSPPDER